MAKKQSDFLGMSNVQLLELLVDEKGKLSQHIKGGLTSGEIVEPRPEITESSHLVESSQNYASIVRLAEQSSLGGIFFHVIRKGSGHNDPNWGRILTRGGRRDYGYGRHAVGDLFSLGTNDCRAEVWRPWWIGIGKVTYHTRVELYFDPAHWDPGGVAWWGEVWGWWSIGKESKLEGWGFKMTLT